MSKTNGAKRANGNGAAHGAAQSGRASIELVRPVRDLRGREVTTFYEGEAAWRLVAEMMEVVVPGTDSPAAALLLPPGQRQAQSQPRVELVPVAGYEIVQVDNEAQRAVRMWVPVEAVVAVRMPLTHVTLEDAAGGKRGEWMRVSAAEQLMEDQRTRAEQASDGELVRGGETVQ